MYQTTYYIDKLSNTFADNLAAFGLAFVLNGIANGRSNIRIEDKGAVFAIICDPAIQEEWVNNCVFFAGGPFLVTFDNQVKRKVIKGTSLSITDLPEQGGNLVIDYQVEKQNRIEFFEWLKALSKEDKRKVLLGELHNKTAPHPDWDIFRAINPGALQSYNALIAEWQRGNTGFAELLKILLAMTTHTPNNLDKADAAWSLYCKARRLVKSGSVTASQLLNPAQGKGTNNPKAEWREPNNLKGFWLLEWLKTVGLFYGGITRIVANPRDPKNAKDRKTYVLNPVKLGWSRHQEVMHEFKKAMVGNATSVKMDIYVALRYTQAFLKHYEGARDEDLSEELYGHPPAYMVSGMQTAFYKSLGNSTATMNIAAINLPRWVIPNNRQELAMFMATLDEHLTIIRKLDETRGDQYTLLISYRDFLSGANLDSFFEFTNAYSGFIIHQRERGQYIRQFSTTTLEVLFMNSDDSIHTYHQIIQNLGFKNVAYAIRHSTVVPQSIKRRGGRPAVEVRYGLGQQLARKAAYPADFLAELSEFLALYNAENAQLREKGRNPFRKNITTSDIDAVTELVDRFGSKVVCNMLVAYGYASERKEEGESESSTGPGEASIEMTDNVSDDQED